MARKQAQAVTARAMCERCAVPIVRYAQRGDGSWVWQHDRNEPGPCCPRACPPADDAITLVGDALAAEPEQLSAFDAVPEYTPEEQALIDLATERIVAAAALIAHEPGSVTRQLSAIVEGIAAAFGPRPYVDRRNAVDVAAALLGVEPPPLSPRHELMRHIVKLLGQGSETIARKLVDGGWTPPPGVPNLAAPSDLAG